MEGGAQRNINNAIGRKQGGLDAFQRIGGSHRKTGSHRTWILVNLINPDDLLLEGNLRSGQYRGNLHGEDRRHHAAGVVRSLNADGGDIGVP